MQINNRFSLTDMRKSAGNITHRGNGCFADIMSRKTNAGLDSYIGSERKTRPDCEIYGRVFQTDMHRYDTRAIKDVETEKYSITRREGGYLCIYEKARGNTKYLIGN